MRLHDGSDVAIEPDDFLNDFLIKRGRRYSSMQRIMIKYTGTGSNGYTQISIPNAVFDGTTTPIVVYVISSSASDTNVGGAGHAEKVTIIGLDENGIIKKEKVETNGTTQVATTTKWKRIFHAYCSEWGSGGDDAAGNITITNTGQAATYLTIAAGVNESDGCKFWVDTGAIVHNPSHYHTLITTDNLNRKIRVKYVLKGFGSLGNDPDFTPLEYTASTESASHTCARCAFKASADDASVDGFESYVGGAEDFDMLSMFWVYS